MVRKVSSSRCASNQSWPPPIFLQFGNDFTPAGEMAFAQRDHVPGLHEEDRDQSPKAEWMQPTATFA